MTLLFSVFTTVFLQAACVGTVFCLAITVFRRLVFHPLANFPGPKLAALSRWYEFYYDVVLKGRLTFHIRELHQKYGPIIRITPEEIHIADSHFWDELYGRNSKADKYAWQTGRFSAKNAPKTHADTVEYEVHRIRRAAVNPLFSKRAIYEMEPLLLSKLSLVCEHFTRHSETSRPINLVDVWTGLTGDIITELSWGTCYNALASEGCRDNLHAAVVSAGQFSNLSLQFPSLHHILKSIPHEWLIRLWPKREPLLRFGRVMGERISLLLNDVEPTEKPSQPILFKDLLRSDLPSEHKAIPRLIAETANLVGAGVETSARALSVASFHIINNPLVCRRLKQELLELVPDTSGVPSLRDLERGTYLAACVREGVRLSGGVPGRSARLIDREMVYGSWTIPARTPISMSIWDVDMDEDIFPDPKRFVPERWLGSARTADDTPLERYFVGFGKGDRSCVGLNLALAEITLGLGTAFRQFEFELFETDETDVELVHDFLIGTSRLDSRGVRVHVRKAS